MKRLLIITTLGLTLISCNKDGNKHPCWDSALVHNGVCTADCPGFEGCDGKTYCNACEAAKVGIGPR